MLYEDLLFTVLSKLPVKSLLRFRCVSKLWFNLIDHSYLINMHLNHTKKNSSNTMFIASYAGEDQILSMYDFDNPEDEVKKIESPVPCNSIHVHTCNGLICFCNEDKDNNTIIIWNPATHKHRQVAAVKGCHPYCIGFGYDHKTDDYKVVMLEKVIIKEEEKCFIVHVYSLKTGLWRRTADTTNEIVGPYLSVYASGAIHWMDYYPVKLEPLEKKNRLVAFDLTTEKWLPRTLPPVPRNRLHNSLKSWALSNHQGSLCASYAGDKPNLVDLWVMKYEQGIRSSNSWSKLLTVKRNKGIVPTKITPVWSLKKMSQKQVLLHNGERLYSYDIEKGTRKDFSHVGSVLGIFKSFICYQSLVPV